MIDAAKLAELRSKSDRLLQDIITADGERCHDVSLLTLRELAAFHATHFPALLEQLQRCIGEPFSSLDATSGHEARIARLTAEVSRLTIENEHFRTATGYTEGEKIVGSQPGSLLIDGRGGMRSHVTLMADELRELQRLREFFNRCCEADTLVIKPPAIDAARK